MSLVPRITLELHSHGISSRIIHRQQPYPEKRPPAWLSYLRPCASAAALPIRWRLDGRFFHLVSEPGQPVLGRSRRPSPERRNGVFPRVLSACPLDRLPPIHSPHSSMDSSLPDAIIYASNYGMRPGLKVPGIEYIATLRNKPENKGKDNAEGTFAAELRRASVDFEQKELTSVEMLVNERVVLVGNVLEVVREPRTMQISEVCIRS